MGVQAERREAKLNQYRVAQLGLDVNALVEQYRGDIGPQARYASFDYCYSYFRGLGSDEGPAAIASDEHLKDSCFQLGMYLASWGMYRGSGPLLPVSVRALEDAVRFIAAAPDVLWEIDVNGYGDHAEFLLSQARDLRAALPGGKKGAPRTTDTLVTKVMLGVFGCIPALDANFLESFGSFSLNEEFLAEVQRFYEERSDVIDGFQIEVMSFDDWQPTGWTYSRAKVIDMIFFQEGARRALARKTERQAKKQAK